MPFTFDPEVGAALMAIGAYILVHTLQANDRLTHIRSAVGDNPPPPIPVRSSAHKVNTSLTLATHRLAMFKAVARCWTA